MTSELHTSMIRTVLGDIPANELGATSCHEHLIIDSPFVAEQFPHIHLDSVADAVAELGPWKEVGLRAVVDAMPSGQGRDVSRLAAISEQSGVHVVAATGLHTAKYYEHVPWALDPDPDHLVGLFVSELTDGADGVEARCGVIKVATGHDGVDDRARRVFAAAAEAHRLTGAPLLTHCEDGHDAVDQVHLLTDMGVPLDAVVLSHTDKVADVGYHREILESGVSVEYDQALRQDPDEPAGSAWLTAQMTAEGFPDQIMLGTDGARRTLWSTLGGSPGLAWLLTGYPTVLARHGVDSRTVTRFLVDNPARWLALRLASINPSRSSVPASPEV